MCEFCNKPYKNMSVSEGEIRIAKSKYSPSGYKLVADNSGGEYAEADCPIWNCPMCGRKLTETEG